MANQETKEEVEFWDEEAEKSKEEKKQEREKKAKEFKQREKPKVNLDGEKVRDGLAQLILTVVELLRELMEKQAIRRIEKGTLNDKQIEDLGNTFQALRKEIEKLKKYFNLEDEDLDMDLGPLTIRGDDDEKGKASVVEILDRLLGKGVVVKGDVVISVAEVDLISLNLGLLLASIDKAQELYGNSNTSKLRKELEEAKKENEILRKSQPFTSHEVSGNEKLKREKSKNK
jgi:hypothetical protein